MQLKNNRYKSLNAQAKAMQDKNCCGVIAVAVALNSDYKTAYGMCAKVGRKHKSGMYTYEILHALKLAGKTVTKLDKQSILFEVNRPNYKVKTLTNNNFKMSETYQNGTYLVFNCDHVAAVKNGVTHDWSVNKAKKVINVYAV